MISSYPGNILSSEAQKKTKLNTEITLVSILREPILTLNGHATTLRGLYYATVKSAYVPAHAFNFLETCALQFVELTLNNMCFEFFIYNFDERLQDKHSYYNISRGKGFVKTSHSYLGAYLNCLNLNDCRT